jgi:hypothetical protein
MRLDERHKPDGGANLHRFYIRSSLFLETFFIVSSFRFDTVVPAPIAGGLARDRTQYSMSQGFDSLLRLQK